MPRLSDDRGRVVVGAVGCVEGDRGVGVGRLEPFEHLLLGQPEVGGELGDRGGAAVLLGQLAGGLGQQQLELLQPARDPDRPALVAEVPLDLADDRRGRVGRELDPALEVEPVDRLDQPDRRHLDQVVERLAAVAEPAGEVLDQRQVHLDQLVAGPWPWPGRPGRASASSANSSRAWARSCRVRSPCSGGAARAIVGHVRTGIRRGAAGRLRRLGARGLSPGRTLGGRADHETSL